jgi:GT2 family glycosyltransferase
VGEAVIDRDVYIIVPTACEANYGAVVGGILAYTCATPITVVNASRRCATNIGIHAVITTRIGYVNAVNLGYGMIFPSSDDAVVGTINDDVEVKGDFVTPMLEVLDSGAAQVGASVHGIGRDGMWDDSPGRFAFAEGWCWLAKMSTIEKASLTFSERVVYDRGYSPGYCEDCDLSLRIQRDGGRVLQVQNLPLLHLRSQTFGFNREPYWSRNRAKLVGEWNLASP